MHELAETEEIADVTHRFVRPDGQSRILRSDGPEDRLSLREAALSDWGWTDTVLVVLTVAVVIAVALLMERLVQ